MAQANRDILRGWAQIERLLGVTRKTILAQGFPVQKAGGVWAFRHELIAHLETISAPIREGNIFKKNKIPRNSQ